MNCSSSVDIEIERDMQVFRITERDIKQTALAVHLCIAVPINRESVTGRDGEAIWWLFGKVSESGTVRVPIYCMDLTKLGNIKEDCGNLCIITFAAR